MLAFFVKYFGKRALIKLLSRAVLIVHADMFVIDQDINCTGPGSGLCIYGNRFACKSIFYICICSCVIYVCISMSL